MEVKETKVSTMKRRRSVFSKQNISSTEEKQSSETKPSLPMDENSITRLILNKKSNKQRFQQKNERTRELETDSSSSNDWMKTRQKKYDRPPQAVSKLLLYQKSKQSNTSSRAKEVIHNELSRKVAGLGIFNVPVEEQVSDGTRLSTWEALENKEMNLQLQTNPRNVLQELIQWTEDGKLWHFPINNEQGMEEEENVHFSEHVFMERHLEGWCPKKGPIRHFMELVCTGLSKNPYMTVDEKIGHITWYKDYFESKKDLLDHLGVLDDAMTTITSKDQKQINP